MPSTIRAKLAAAARWLAPSAVAACTGAVAAGIVEGSGMETMLGGAAAAGFVAIVMIPCLFVASAAARALWVAWQPRGLGVIEPDGSAPRLAGWAATIWLSIAAIAWVMFQGTWMIAAATAFKPVTLALAEPILAVAVVVVVAAISRPLANGLAAIYRRIDARWRKRVSWSLVSPRAIVLSLVIKTLVVGYVVWRIIVRPRLGPFDVTLFEVPLVALAATLAAHVIWPRLGRVRVYAGSLAIVAGLGAVSVATFSWRVYPSLTLAIWGERPIAGLAIDRLLDLDAIRARMSLAEFRPVARPGSPHPDIILITIDTVRADHTPPYGGSAEMPLLRELAARGAVFEWAFSPSNVTRRSIPSMVTGLSPNRVRGRVVGWALRTDPRHVLLAERMLAGGYETAGFVCCYGFWGADFRTGLQRGLQTLVIEPQGMKLAKQARAWLDAREKHPNGKPLFVWMHLLEPHNWQQGNGNPTSEEEKRKFYDRSLTAADTMATELLGAFSDRAPENAPIVIITADHGEGLGDHGSPYHSTDLYDSQIHVPLVLAGPGIKPGRISETVSLTDLTPTIVELAGFEAPHGPAIDGHSFADLASGRRFPNPDDGTAFAAMIKDRSNPGGLTAVVRGPWKLIEGAGYELYNVRIDPNEKSNVISTHVTIYEELKKLLERFKARANDSPFE